MQEGLRQSLRPRHGHQPNPARCQGNLRPPRSAELAANIARQATGATATTSASAPVSLGSAPCVIFLHNPCTARLPAGSCLSQCACRRHSVRLHPTGTAMGQQLPSLWRPCSGQVPWRLAQTRSRTLTGSCRCTIPQAGSDRRCTAQSPAGHGRTFSCTLCAPAVLAGLDSC